MDNATWIKAAAPPACPGPNANLPIAHTLADKTPACHQCTHSIQFPLDNSVTYDLCVLDRITAMTELPNSL
jgi:hypothetical protein